MINLAGKEVGKDIDIEYTGLRPGEKIFEELFHESEMLVATKYNKILLSESRDIGSTKLEPILNTMETACCKYNIDVLLTIIQQLVPELRVAENNSSIEFLDEEIVPV